MTMLREPNIRIGFQHDVFQNLPFPKAGYATRGLLLPAVLSFIAGFGGAKKEARNSRFVANAFSGLCVAMPCQVRDETYIKVRGIWTYLYRAADRDGKTRDFMLSERRNFDLLKGFVKQRHSIADRDRQEWCQWCWHQRGQQNP